MWLTSKSTKNSILNSDFNKLKKECNYSIALAGNPNVRKIHYF